MKFYTLEMLKADQINEKLEKGSFVYLWTFFLPATSVEGDEACVEALVDLPLIPTHILCLQPLIFQKFT